VLTLKLDETLDSLGAFACVVAEHRISQEDLGE
jgi:hypothetical protein